MKSVIRVLSVVCILVSAVLWWFGSIPLTGPMYLSADSPAAFTLNSDYWSLEPSAQLLALQIYAEVAMDKASTETDQQRYAAVAAVLDAYTILDEYGVNKVWPEPYKDVAYIEFDTYLVRHAASDLAKKTHELLTQMYNGAFADATEFAIAYENIYGMSPKMVANQYEGPLPEVIRGFELEYALIGLSPQLLQDPGVYLVGLPMPPINGIGETLYLELTVPIEGSPFIKNLPPASTTVDVDLGLGKIPQGFNLNPYISGLLLVLGAIMWVGTLRRPQPVRYT